MSAQFSKLINRLERQPRFQRCILRDSDYHRGNNGAHLVALSSDNCVMPPLLRWVARDSALVSVLIWNL